MKQKRTFFFISAEQFPEQPNGFRLGIKNACTVIGSAGNGGFTGQDQAGQSVKAGEMRSHIVIIVVNIVIKRTDIERQYVLNVQEVQGMVTLVQLTGIVQT